MAGEKQDQRTRKFGFVLVEGYALMSAAAAVEPLRAANMLAGRTLYETAFLSIEGGPARSSAGSVFDTMSIEEAGMGFDLVFVAAGGDPFVYSNRTLDGYLRRLASRGVPLGGISGGGVILASAGLMANRRFTVHWHHIEALRLRNDRHLIERRLFVIDRDRYSCAGGAAPLDMMHAIIAADHGAEFARRISDWFIHTQVRMADEPQRAGLQERYGIHHPALLSAVELMTTHIADPLALEQLAALSGIGIRQLLRMFVTELGQPPMAFYRDLRLEKANELLQQSALPITEIGLATGFANPAHFARVYRARYGETPRARRNGSRARSAQPDQSV